MAPVDTKKMRVFLALPLAELFGAEVAPFIEKWRSQFPAVRWVKSTDIHVTLHFFGPVEKESVERINALVRPLAQACAPFEISLKSTGAFPSLSHPRVFWVGMEGNIAPLSQLQNEISKSLSGAGYSVEERAFKPHLTVGRVREGKKESFLPAALDFPPTRPGRMDRIVLFQSELTPGGSHYEILETYPFSKA